jgi:hypothetical protein
VQEKIRQMQLKLDAERSAKKAVQQQLSEVSQKARVDEEVRAEISNARRRILGSTVGKASHSTQTHLQGTHESLQRTSQEFALFNDLGDSRRVAALEVKLQEGCMTAQVCLAWIKSILATVSDVRFETS